MSFEARSDLSVRSAEISIPFRQNLVRAFRILQRASPKVKAGGVRRDTHELMSSGM